VRRQQAYRNQDPFDADQGLGCATCAVFILAMVVIGAVATYVLLKTYHLL
jgi:archaellin